MLFAARIDADDDTKPIISASQAAVDAMSPDVDSIFAAQIHLAPLIIFTRQLDLQP